MSFASIKFDDHGNPYHGNDKNLVVEFFTVKDLQTKAPASPPSADPTNPTIETKPVEAVTDEKGNFVYNERTFIRIITPGVRATVVEREAKRYSDANGPADIERFPYQWERFQKGLEQKANGHDLAEMGLGNREVKCFNESNIYTVEQLINVPDGILPDVILGARSIRDKAKIWLENKLSETNRVTELEKRLAQQEAQIAELLKKNNPTIKKE